MNIITYKSMLILDSYTHFNALSKYSIECEWKPR